MLTPIAVIAGDTHLRPTTWAKHPELSGDSYFGLQQLVAAAVNLRVPLVLAGDIFDNCRPDSRSVVVFAAQMDRMQGAGLPVYCIQGNHDQANPAWFQIHTWPVDLHLNSVVIHGIEFYGLQFVPSEELAAALGEMPATTNVLVCHQSWVEVQRIGHTDGSLSEIPAALTVFSGDYHIHGSYRGAAADGGEIWLHSPGSMCLQALNEDPEKQFFVAGLDGGGALCVESRPLYTRRCITLLAGNEDEFNQAIATISQPQPPTPKLLHAYRKPILRVRYNDLIPDAFDRLVAAAGDRFHLFPEPQRIVDNMVMDVTATPEDAFDGLMSALDELFPDGGVVHGGVQRLLVANDPDAEIAQQFEEFKESYAQTQPEENAEELPASPVGGNST
jgi:hypothetical protein